jgi:dTDP-glucose 4,6-dehydratase
MKTVIVTGGAGFIGSHLVKEIANKTDWKIIVVDKLTYAGNLKNLDGIDVDFRCIDIADTQAINELMNEKIDIIYHLAAESHVDRSIENPMEFVNTNVVGTVNLLNLGLHYHKQNEKFLFYHISTDEVFGSLDLEDPMFDEETPYDPRSPYSASKAASDHFVRAYHHTYKLPIIISNCSNNYGTHQYPEKLIPVVINSINEGKPIPIYGQGSNVRDWLHVKDHARAILKISQSGNIGRTYCIGGDCEMTNLELVNKICEIYERIYNKHAKYLITFVQDRKGHDMRYAIDHNLLTFHTGWKPMVSIEEGLEETIRWYTDNR